MRAKRLLFIALVLSAACGAPPHPPKPPTPGFADAPTLEEAEASTMLVASPTPPTTAPLAVESPVPLGGPVPAATAEPELADLTGAYTYKSGKSSVRKSIDAVVDEMSIIVRATARKRLVAANAVPRTVVITQVGHEVTVSLDGKDYVAVLGGSARKVRDPNGEVSRMRYAMRDDALYQIFHTDQGDRTNVFTAREGGGLNMSVRIKSSRLPADVRYRLTFSDSA